MAAFPDETFRPTVAGSFTAVGQSEATFIYAGDVFISGTFVGTVQLESQTRGGTWVPSRSCIITNAEAPDVKQFRFAVTRPVRLNCTAFTSGQIDYSIESILAYEEAR